MDNIEEQFDSLIEELHTLIREKQVRGDLTRADADALAEMVDARLNPPAPQRAWASSRCW